MMNTIMFLFWMKFFVLMPFWKSPESHYKKILISNRISTRDCRFILASRWKYRDFRYGRRQREELQTTSICLVPYLCRFLSGILILVLNIKRLYLFCCKSKSMNRKLLDENTRWVLEVLEGPVRKYIWIFLNIVIVSEHTGSLVLMD